MISYLKFQIEENSNSDSDMPVDKIFLSVLVKAMCFGMVRKFFPSLPRTPKFILKFSTFRLELVKMNSNSKELAVLTEED